MRWLRVHGYAGLIALLLASVTAAAAPVLVPPRADQVGAWQSSARLAGFDVLGSAEAPEILLVDLGAEWEVVATLAGRVRTVRVPPPRTAADREDVAWLAASLLAELDARAKAEEAARRTTTVPRAAPERRFQPEGPAAEPPPGLAPTPPQPEASPPVAVEPAPNAASGPAAPRPPPGTDHLEDLDTPRRAARTDVALGLGLGWRAHETPLSSLDLLLLRRGVAGGVSLGAGMRLSAPRRVDTGYDDERLWEQQIDLVVSAPAGAIVAEARGGVAVRTFAAPSFQIATLAVPVAGARALGSLRASERIAIRVGPELRYDLVGVVVREQPWPDRRLPRLTIGLSADVGREEFRSVVEPPTGLASPPR